MATEEENEEEDGEGEEEEEEESSIRTFTCPRGALGSCRPRVRSSQARAGG